MTPSLLNKMHALEQVPLPPFNVPTGLPTQMSRPSSPYDILGVISFVQGCLTLIAAVFGALWSVTQQVRVNKLLMDSLFSKITHLQVQHGGSLVKSGTTRRLLRELEQERMALDPMSIASPLHKWLNQSQFALDLATISNNVETIVSKFYLIDIRDQIIKEILNKGPHVEQGIIADNPIGLDQEKYF